MVWMPLQPVKETGWWFPRNSHFQDRACLPDGIRQAIPGEFQELLTLAGNQHQ